MQIYKVPYNFNHEEKIFGGYLSIRQAIYMVIGASTAGILFVPFIPMFIKVLLFLSFASIFVSFAFLKVDETNADKYFTYILKYFFKNKKYILEKGK